MTLTPMTRPDGAVDLGTLTWLPAPAHPEFLAAPVAAGLAELAARDPEAAAQVYVAPIDPEMADTAAMTEAYELDLALSANCVLVAGSRSGDERVAACVVRATTRADVNSRVRKLLDVRKASFWPMATAVEQSGMEYGAITPLGLPASWRLLLDTRAVEGGWAIIGSGIRGSKILLPGEALALLAGAEVIDGLANEA